LRRDPVTSAKVDAIARTLAGEEANEDRLTSAADFVRAQFKLLRIRSTRTELMAKIDLDHNTQELRRVAALDRYERYCFTRRRRAGMSLEAAPGGLEGDGIQD
jgi:hypothetical protein